MNRKLLNKILALTILTTTCISSAASASGAELPKNFNNNKGVEDRMTIYDVVRSYKSYQGKSVQTEEVRRQSNGDVYYYRGTAEYIGRDGLFGDYKYLGDLRKFTIYKIVKSDGTVITPQNITN